MRQRVGTAKAKWGAVAVIVTASMVVGVGQAAAAKNHHKKGSSPSSWSIMDGAKIPAANEGNTSLNAVSCPDATDCEAVGGTQGAYGAGDQQPFVEQLSGSTWSITPIPTTGLGGNLLGVSCVDASDCMAVGSAGAAPLAEWWNGSSWSSSPTVNVDGGNITLSTLDSVSCTSGTAGAPDNCVAVGYAQGQGGGALIETWNGSTWTVALGPTNGIEIEDQLSSVSCAVQGQCMAVGTGGGNLNLALQLSDGSWTPTDAPDPAGTDQNWMQSVSCPQANDCIADWWASSLTSGNAQQEAITWNGTTWSARNTLASGAAPEIFWATCPTTSSCVAVGLKDAGQAQKTLVKTGNGTSRWKVLPSANRTHESSLNEVACASPSFCVAVGTSIFGGGDPLIESGPA
jgi:hypothetical protein